MPPVFDFLHPNKDFRAATPGAPVPIDYTQELANIREGQHSSTLNKGGKAVDPYLALYDQAKKDHPDATYDPGTHTIHIPAPGGDAPTFSTTAYTGGNGWRSGLDPNEAWIIQRESGFSPTAFNKTVVYSGGRAQHAFGIGQLIDSNREFYAKKLGISNPNTVNPMEQLAMMRAYIKDRYGSSAAAKAYWAKTGKGY